MGHWSDIFDDNKLSSIARLVFCCLVKYADKSGQCYPSITKIGKGTGLSRPTVVKSIAELKKNGNLQITKRKSDKSANLTNLYSLIPFNQNDTILVNDINQDTPFLVNEVNYGSKAGLLGVVNQVNSNISIKNITKEHYSSRQGNLAELLRTLILENNPKAKTPARLDSWANTIRLMVERDKRTEEEIETVIEWCQQDSFWKVNILSADSLRRQFDRLFLKMSSEKKEERKIIWAGDDE